MKKRRDESENPEKRKAQRTAAGLCFIIFVAIVVVIGFLNGDLLGDTLQQKIFATLVGAAIIIGVFVLIFKRKE